MVILDTNVLSALMLLAPDETVIRWMDRQEDQSTWVTSVSLFEIQVGVALLPFGRRREALESAFERVLNHVLENRVLDFDASAARAAAYLTAQRRRTGRNVEIRDTQIAGIVVARGATLATRNVRDFDDIDARIINPWDA
ncbi:MAG TPA: type II toxin-antitoxin system VapC family toxin [Bryobacteraceae bacterium]|jgi:predicted nucleic acid-binding protein|nr:type II toxin-antitoxin system VapC family toxin [Bryobacteraceae bacterium]